MNLLLAAIVEFYDACAQSRTSVCHRHQRIHLNSSLLKLKFGTIDTLQKGKVLLYYYFTSEGVEVRN